MSSIKQLRRMGTARLLASPFLSKNGSYSLQEAILDVDVLLSNILKKNRATLVAHSDADASFVEQRFYNILEERYRGRNIAYILGEKEFFALSFYVDDSVLVPKADTELLVEKGIEAILERFKNSKEDEILNLNIMDAFSGSGCVGISVFASISSSINAHFTFLDISPRALEVSKKNVGRLLTEEKGANCSFLQHDATLSLPTYNGKKYDIIMANPPYVPQKMVSALLSDGRGEPVLALDGGEDGYAIFETFAKNAHDAMVQNGILLCEVGDGQAENVAKIFKTAGFSNCEAFKDLSSKYRVLSAKRD